MKKMKNVNSQQNGLLYINLHRDQSFQKAACMNIFSPDENTVDSRYLKLAYLE